MIAEMVVESKKMKVLTVNKRKNFLKKMLNATMLFFAAMEEARRLVREAEARHHIAL